jgi:transglutaminase-like putative cysteine protease
MSTIQLEVRHVTRFAFSRRARYSIHDARLTPRPGAGQRLRTWSILMPGRRVEWKDGYGNAVVTCSVTAPHDEVAIEARGVYEYADGETWLSSADPEPLPLTFWLRNRGLARHGAEIADFVGEFWPRAADANERVQLLHDLLRRIRDTVAYRSGASDVTTTATDALVRREGVCQDHAHLFIAGARSLGIPARYVSGYLRTDSNNAMGAASHAWAEAFVPDLGWVGFDPANGISPTGDYLKLAVGLDYRDAAPVTGRRLGSGEAASMTVEVEVRRCG